MAVCIPEILGTELQVTSCSTSEGGQPDQPVYQHQCNTRHGLPAPSTTSLPRVPLIQFPAHSTIHRIFTVYSPEVTFTSDSGATDILIRASDSHILTHYNTYTDSASPPGFDVANYNQIFLIAHGKLSIPNTQITLDAFVFLDDDLHSTLTYSASLY